LKQFSQTRYY